MSTDKEKTGQALGDLDACGSTIAGEPISANADRDVAAAQAGAVTAIEEISTAPEFLNRQYPPGLTPEQAQTFSTLETAWEQFRDCCAHAPTSVRDPFYEWVARKFGVKLSESIDEKRTKSTITHIPKVPWPKPKFNDNDSNNTADRGSEKSEVSANNVGGGNDDDVGDGDKDDLDDWG